MARRTDVSGTYSHIVHRYLYMYTHMLSLGNGFQRAGVGIWLPIVQVPKNLVLEVNGSSKCSSCWALAPSYGSFPEKGEPIIDPNILQSFFTPKKAPLILREFRDPNLWTCQIQFNGLISPGLGLGFSA